MAHYTDQDTSPVGAYQQSIQNDALRRGFSNEVQPAFLAHVIAKLDRAINSVTSTNGTLNALELRVFGPSLSGGLATDAESRGPNSEEGQIISRLETLIGAAINADETAARLASRL